MVEALGVPPETLIVSFFGNLVSRKRPFDFVRAIAAFKSAYPSSPIIAPIFGKPQAFSIAEVEAFAEEQGVADCVRLMGFRYPSERWLAGSDVLFVPSVREPFGRTLIEAMIVGTVVVAVDSGGNPEAIENGETGYLIPIEDAAAAASRFHEIAIDREAAGRLAERAQADVMQRFGMQRHADAIMAVYDHLLSGHPITAPSGLAPGLAPAER
jgi:glycosyltransferase involved in cell wall biosynthesis